MPGIEQSIILLPCYSLEDFQVSRGDEEAEEILAGWCGLFHPALLHRTQMLPRWERAYDPPHAPQQTLIVIPECSEKNLPSTWLADLPKDQVVVIRRYKNLANLWRMIKEMVPEILGDLSEDVTRDFVAVGFAYLHVELMTRQLRYMSNLDEIRFRDSVLKAAASAVAGKPEDAREQLQRAFDLLTEAREYFYPVQAYLLDLTLTAHTTLGPALRRELELQEKVNLLTTGQILRAMAEREPKTHELLRSVLAEGKVNVLGGEEDESLAALLPQPALVFNLRAGAATWQQLLETRPTVFGRRVFGLTPLLPGLLSHLRFEGTLHFALDDGKFPVSNQSKMRWEGIDDGMVDSLARIPVDASRASTFLQLGETIGRMLDLDHAAAVVFAHWPGQTSPWYDTLRRVTSYSPVLGRFALMGEYFRSTQYVGARVSHKPDDYRPAYLAQHVAESWANPISRWVTFVQRWSQGQTLIALAVMRGLMTGNWDALSCQLWETAQRGWANAVAAVGQREVAFDDSWPDQYHRLLSAAQDSIAEYIRTTGPQTNDSGVLWLNPQGAPCRGFVLPPDSSQPGAESSPPPSSHIQSLTVPALGYAWAAPVSSGQAASQQRERSWWQRLFGGRRTPAVEEAWQLENEFARIVIDRTTGGIQGLYPQPYGRNLLAQRLGFRLGPVFSYGSSTDDPEAEYAPMVAENLSLVRDRPEEPAIRTEGKLVDRKGETVARFVQTVSAPLHLPFFRLRIELEPVRQPEANPWSSYYACRFAWNDETAILRRSIGWATAETTLERFDSLYFTQLAGTGHTVSLLSPGLPYHRVVGTRKLDTLLIVRGETARTFELGIGLNLRYPLQAALQMLQPAIRLGEQAARPRPESAYLMMVDARNVSVSLMQPLVEEGRLVGLTVMLTETEGRSGPVNLLVCRKVTAAHRIDGYGEIQEPLTLTDDGVQLNMNRFQTVEVMLRFGKE